MEEYKTTYHQVELEESLYNPLRNTQYQPLESQNKDLDSNLLLKQR